ncbi:hypothetical protein ASF29_19965 [Rhizobium sp. Leaf262]|nr:hypothetical protein ASF29_19965 [Rhizobium sp. Leaf262]
MFSLSGARASNSLVVANGQLWRDVSDRIARSKAPLATMYSSESSFGTFTVLLPVAQRIIDNREIVHEPENVGFRQPQQSTAQDTKKTRASRPRLFFSQSVAME